jgi:hypothetical protein
MFKKGLPNEKCWSIAMRHGAVLNFIIEYQNAKQNSKIFKDVNLVLECNGLTKKEGRKSRKTISLRSVISCDFIYC